MDFLVLFIAFAVGVTSGFLSGAFGIGGATVKIPLLRVLLSLPGPVAVATSLPLTIPSVVPGVLVYRKHNLIRMRTVAIAGFSGSLFAVAGAFLTKQVPSSLLMISLALVLLLFALICCLERDRPEEAWLKQSRKKRDVFSFLIGAIAGFVSGFLGIGGGPLLVPLLTRLRELPYRKAIPTSLAIMLVYTIPASIAHFMLGNVDLLLMAVLFAGTVAGSHFGALKVIGVNEKKLKQGFSAVLAFLGVLLLLKEFGLLPG